MPSQMLPPIVTLILVVGFYLRQKHGFATELWTDEAFSLLMITHSWEEMLQRITLDVHPPFFYFALKVVSIVVGHSIVYTKAAMVIMSTFSVWLTYLVTTRYSGNHSAGYTASALMAIHPFVIMMGTDIRMYGLGMMLTLLHLLALHNLTRAYPSQHIPTQTWIHVSITTTLLLATHYYLIPIALGSMWAVLWANRKYVKATQRATFMMLGTIFLCYTPWLPQLIEQFSRPDLLAWNADSPLYQLQMGVGIMLSGQFWVTPVFLLTCFAIVSTYGAYILGKRYPKTSILTTPIVWTLAALLLASLWKIASAQPMTFVFWRYAIFSTILLIPLVAICVHMMPQRKRICVTLLLLTGLSISSWTTLDTLTSPIATSTHGVLNILRNAYKDGDIVVIPQSHILMGITVLDPMGEIIPHASRYTTEPLSHYGNIALPAHSAIPMSALSGITPKRAWVITSSLPTDEYLALPKTWTFVSSRKLREIRPSNTQMTLSLYETNPREY
jgi:uncharacterized membrane protein